ncbi:hypothetical protein [Chryseobacterium indoltheticum]
MMKQFLLQSVVKQQLALAQNAYYQLGNAYLGLTKAGSTFSIPFFLSDGL